MPPKSKKENKRKVVRNSDLFAHIRLPIEAIALIKLWQFLATQVLL